MRLLNARTYCLEEIALHSTPPYAILSHTWGEGEISYSDMLDVKIAEQKRGYAKIKSTCDEAVRQGYEHAWVDTCCIDKSSSAELQEAINSMYKWYAAAGECFVYLEDLAEARPAQRSYVSPRRDPSGLPHLNAGSKSTTQMLRDCVWFTRGWTLQELIAPAKLTFYDQTWTRLGDKAYYLDTISAITGAHTAILDHTEELSTVSIAARMSWAAGRRVSRIEDQAYALLGIFGINIPMLYGEGKRAFQRLQEEIIRVSADQSIFAWQSRSCHRGCLLADSPDDFSDSQSIVAWGHAESFAMTNMGLRITLPIVKELYLETTETLAFLNCRYEGDFASTLALRLRAYPRVNHYHVRRDVGGACPHAEGSEPSRRLAKIAASTVLSLPPVSIDITRTFTATTAERKFWLRLPQDTGADAVVKVVDVHPKRRWSRDFRVMRALPYARPRGRILLQLPSGQQIYVVFGCDTAIGVQLPDGSRDQVDIPGLMVRKPESFYGPEDLVGLEYCPEHASNRKACSDWVVAGRCPNMPTRVRIRDRPNDIEIGSATIEEQVLMNESVFVITISVDQIFELS